MANPTAATYKDWILNNLNYLFGGNRGLIESKYKPSKASDPNTIYYTREGMDYDVVRNLLGGKEAGQSFLGNDLFYKDFNDLYSRLNGKTSYRNTDNSTFGEYTVSVGEDENGRYVSYWDKFDYVFPELFGKKNPKEFYNRIYEPDFNKISQDLSNENYYGSNPSGKRFFKSPMRLMNNIILRLKQGGTMDYLNYLKEGSGIHIKKKNRGKFTDYCGGKVTSECIARGKNSPSATIRKRATFAANARKWKHEDGGVIKAATGTELPFIGLRRQINPAVASESEKEYQEKVKKFLAETEPEASGLNIPEEQQVETKLTTTPAEKTDWTAGYRIGEETSSTTPAVKTTVATAKPDMSKVRSDRNNNPLNIRFTNITWQGKKTDGKTDNDFEEFESRDYGWRAAYKNIETKMKRGLNTITKLVSEWAPPSENNTNGYIQFVALKTGIDPNAVITLADLPKIGAAMAAVESGRRNNIDWDDALRGFKFYLGQPT